MTTLSIDPHTDRSEIRRWGLSASFVVGVHVLLICALVIWYTSPPDMDGTGGPSVMVDLETVAPTPDAADKKKAKDKKKVPFPKVNG